MLFAFIGSGGFGCGSLIILLILIAFALDSEIGRGILAIIFGLLLSVMVIGFLIINGAPVIYWCAGATVVFAALQYVKVRAFDRDGGESFTSRIAKGARDAAACIATGIGLVTVAQILLRTVFWFTPDALVAWTEDLLVAMRAGFKSVLDFQALIWTFVILVITTLMAPQLKVISRYSQIRNQVERVFLVILTITSFSFFGSEGIHGYRATLTDQRRKEARESVTNFNDAKRRLVAMAQIESELRNASQSVRVNFRNLVDPPPSGQSPGPTPVKPGNGPQTPSNPGPSWNWMIKNPPSSLKYKDRKMTAYGPQTPEEYAEHIFKSTDEYEAPAEPGIVTEESERLTSAAKILDEVAQSKSDQNPTIEELTNANDDLRKAATAIAEAEAGFVEIIKNIIEESAGTSDSSILKPFAKAMIDAFSETLVKTTIPNTVTSLGRAREWVQARINKPESSDPMNLNWKDRLARLFMNKSQLADDDRRREDDAKRFAEIEEARNLKNAARRLAELQKKDKLNDVFNPLKALQVLVRGNYAILRATPEDNGRPLVTLYSSEPVTFITRESSDGGWVQVRTVDDKIGWIRIDDAIERDGSCVCLR